jgi:hypothetical protein
MSPFEFSETTAKSTVPRVTATFWWIGRVALMARPTKHSAIAPHVCHRYKSTMTQEATVRGCAMKNPWTKRNPFMSMWLSAANTVAGSARGRMTAAGRRQAATMMTRGARQAAEFWTIVLTPPTGAAKRRKRRSR